MEIGIVGAGMTGLTAAYELSKRGHQITIYESASQAGGLSSGFGAPRWTWTLDRFYRHIFAGDRAIIGLAEHLGTPARFYRPTTSLWVNGRPYPYDSPVAATLYPNLPLLLNLRAGLVIAYLKYLVRDGTFLERTTADQWLRRTMGERAYSELWEPMLRGKFKGACNQVNMAWFWARIAARTPRLGYFEGGFQTFIDRLADEVRARDSTIYLDRSVRQIAGAGGQVTVTLEDGTAGTFDRVLTTTSPQSVVKMVAGLADDDARDLLALKSTGAVILILALRESVLTDGTYWLNLPEGEFPCLAMVEHTNFQDRAHYGGDHIVYLGDYLPVDAPQMAMDAEALYAQYREALTKVQPAFRDEWIREMWSFHETYAQPVPLVNHSHRVPRLEKPLLPSLYWASMHHVYPWDRGTNYAVELGQRMAQVIDGTS